jgi:FimV-like protein
MAIRKAWVAMALGAGLLMAGDRLAALGLGVEEVRSGLGQPLVAVLPLIRSAAERFDPQEITVSLAGREAYERAGLDYPRRLRDLRGVVEQSGGGPVLRLSTEMPVYEPLLNLLVELRWPRGRLIRTVTVLLDPVQGLERAPEVRREPSPRTATPTPATATAASAVVPGPARSYGPVARGETLSGIAARLRTDPGVSLRQWMQALYRRNPQAFGASMDVLKQGAVLELPSPEEVARTETPPAPRTTLAKAPEPQPPVREDVPEPPPESGQTQRFYILAGGKEGRADAGSVPANGEAGSAPARTGAGARVEEPAVEQPLPQRLHQARLELQGLRQDNQLLRESMARLGQQILGSRAQLERLLTEYRRLRDVLQALKSAPRDAKAQGLTQAAAGAWVPATAFLGLVALILGFVLIWRQRHAHPPVPVPETGGTAETESLEQEGDASGTAQTRRDPLEWKPLPDAMGPPPGPAKTTSGGSLGGSDQIVAEYLSTDELDLTDSRVHEEVINAPGHEEVKLLLLTFYKELGRHEELQALADKILERHPGASEAFRRQLRAITGAATSPGLAGEVDTEIMEQGHFAPGVPDLRLLDKETGQTREVPAQDPDPDRVEPGGRPKVKRSS